MKKKKFKSSVIIIWLSCYVVLLAFPMLINIYLFGYLYKSIKDEVIQNNNHVMEYMLRNVEEQLQSAEKFCNELYYMPEAVALSKKENWNESDVRYEIHKFITKLNETGDMKENIANFALYFEKQDKIISLSGMYEPDVFYEAYYGKNKEESERWNTELKQKGKAVVSLGDAENPSIFFMKTLSLGRNPQNKVKYIVEIDKQELLNNTLYLSEKQYGEFIMTDNNGNLLLETGSEGHLYDAKLDSFDEEKQDIYKINGKKYVINKMVTADKNIKIYYLIDEKVFFEKNQKAYELIIITTILVVIIGSVLIRIFIKDNYSGLKEVMDLYDVKPQKGINEYELIRNSILTERQEQKKNRETIGKQRIAVKNYTILRLLRGISPNETTENVFMSLGEVPISERFAVAVMKKMTKGNDSLYMQIAAMIKISLVYGKNAVAYSDVGDEIVFIINLRDYSTARIEEELTYAEDYIYNNHSIKTLAVVSDIYNKISDISNGYNETKKLMKSLEVLQKKGVYTVGESLESSNNAYYYPIQIEERLINYIRLGEKDKVMDILSEIYEENFNKRVLSIELVECLMHNIVGTIIKSGGLTTAEDEEATPGYYMKQFNNCSTIEEMKLIIQDMTEQCFVRQPERKKTRNNSFIEEVIEYVNENYADENMNVSTVAYHFGVTQNSLSKMFSREMDIGLLEYITVFRINKAAQLLLSTNYNIADIAKQVGYANYRSFTRVFTKQYGVTANQYRELNKS